jgi:hypothetical protein
MVARPGGQTAGGRTHRGFAHVGAQGTSKPGTFAAAVHANPLDRADASAPSMPGLSRGARSGRDLAPCRVEARPPTPFQLSEQRRPKGSGEERKVVDPADAMKIPVRSIHRPDQLEQPSPAREPSSEQEL